MNVQLRTSVKSPPQSVKHKAHVKKNPLQRVSEDISLFPELLSISSSHFFPWYSPQPTAHLNPFHLLRKHSKSSKEGKSCRVNKRTSYEGKKKTLESFS